MNETTKLAMLAQALLNGAHAYDDDEAARFCNMLTNAAYEALRSLECDVNDGAAPDVRDFVSSFCEQLTRETTAHEARCATCAAYGRS